MNQLTMLSLLSVVTVLPTTARCQSIRTQVAESQPVRVRQSTSQTHAGNELFEVLPGFQVEKLFTVPKEALGSWVCITFDNEGRLLASDQGEWGLCRITPPPVSGSRGPSRGCSETIVEQLDFSRCEIRPTAAQGMLYAFDSLYLSINGADSGTGLYRARDTDGDDQFDECVLLKELQGSGEHGPHALRLSPDGKRIFLIAGNHTDPPFQPGEERNDERYSCRMPPTWREDLLLPRMWDPSGHARGRLAPGGWIASTDPDGRTWDIWSIGYRNPYDMAFNTDGELFTYDADMEYDVGLPWYRPTRVVHATSGSEFGWRSGSGKWPAYYLDSLPPVLNIGPGSPVGVEFGYGLKFPSKYQRALYLCDWTFGTMYALHLEPKGSTYRATKEEFLSRTPLPLTDVAAGRDGALYFTVGGRGTQSELFRVTYQGTKSVTRASGRHAEFRAERTRRRQLETYHVFPRPTVTANHRNVSEFAAGTNAWNIYRAFDSGDRHLRFAAMRAAQALHASMALSGEGYMPETLSGWLLLATGLVQLLPNSENALTVADGSGVSAIRSGELRSRLIHEFDNSWDEAALTDETRLNMLRLLSLVLHRLGPINEAERLALASAVEPNYPTENRELNRELCQLLVYLKAPGVVENTIRLMQQDSADDGSDIPELLKRNNAYREAISESYAHPPDRQQTWYAWCLRVAEVGWTRDLRADYFRWFAKSQNWSGGYSFRKFLENIENEAWEKTPENERLLLEAAGARTPFRVAELPQAEGPGQDWTLENVRVLAAERLHYRDFSDGRKMFAAARCIVCHRFAGDGGSTGPDLTQLAGRFNINDLTEAIIEPSRVISDQYRGSTVVMRNGQAVHGRIVAENDVQISVLTDAEDSTKFTDIIKADITEIAPSDTSLMPQHLLNTLNHNEVLNLLAYLLSRGDPASPLFHD